MNGTGNLSDDGLASAASLHDQASALCGKPRRRRPPARSPAAAEPRRRLWDVIEVTDEASRLAAARYRVRGIGLDYRPGAGKYEMKLRLGGV